MKFILEERGYQVAAARNGREALAALEERKPTLVISDVVMPEMDGYELCRRITSDERFKEIPVILLTSLSDPRDVIKGLECGAKNFITKPYDGKYLLSRVEYVLTNQELRKGGGSQIGIEIFFAGQKHFITADRLQILDLLLSVYEAAVRKNQELAQAQDDLRGLNESLEKKVAERTAALQAEIAERLRAEEELKIYAAKLEQSNRELQDFAYVASHDLQEPLRKVQAFGDRLKSKCGEALSEQGRDYLERMQQAAGRMQSLISDLLLFSRVATKARPFAPVNLVEVARGVLSDLEARIEQTGGRVEVGELPTIEGDASQLRQLLQNLISNALKFHQPEVTPVVKVHAQFLNGQPHSAGPPPANRQCQIVVEDNGIGFDEKFLDRIFVPFQRLHGRTEYEGTGMGLAICRKITERHGGAITARSAQGQGSTFIVTLPVTQPKGEDEVWRKTAEHS